MLKMLSFTSRNTSQPVHVHPDKFVGFTPVFGAGAKPEDKPVGMQILLVNGEVIVSDSYGAVVNTLRNAGLEI
jgi:hypothetical protein